MHATAIQQILPTDRIDEFKEFHAYELYKGTGAFEGTRHRHRMAEVFFESNAAAF